MTSSGMFIANVHGKCSSVLIYDFCSMQFTRSLVIYSVSLLNGPWIYNVVSKVFAKVVHYF